MLSTVRTKRAAQLMRALHEFGVGGLSAYNVRGLSGETATFFYSKRPFEPEHLPEALKIEVFCEDESVDGIVAVIAREARTGAPGDRLVAIQPVEQVRRIREIQLD